MFDYRKPCLYLVRHGSTREDRWDDPPLDEQGRLLAEEIANYLSYESIGQIISSEAQRAVQTAEILVSASRNSYVDVNSMVRSWGIGEQSWLDICLSLSGDPNVIVIEPGELVALYVDEGKLVEEPRLGVNAC